MPEVRTRPVYLRPLKDEDSPRLFQWINDRDLVILNAPFRPVSPEAHQRWFETVRQRSDLAIFGMVRTDDETLIGTCQLHSIDHEHGNAELQIRIGEADARGQGLGTAAVRQLLRHGFAELKLHRIYLHVFRTNERAIRSYEKAGFRQEGVLRQAACIEGEYVDVVVMGILADEFTG